MKILMSDVPDVPKLRWNAFSLHKENYLKCRTRLMTQFSRHFCITELITYNNTIKTVPVPVAPSDGALWQDDHKLRHLKMGITHTERIFDYR
jgi:hypothetical protein